MKKQTLKIQSFKSQLAKSQVIDAAQLKAIKGGTKGDPPPWGSDY